jgi:hypothetical protein
MPYPTNLTVPAVLADVCQHTCITHGQCTCTNQLLLTKLPKKAVVDTTDWEEKQPPELPIVVPSEQDLLDIEQDLLDIAEWPLDEET